MATLDVTNLYGSIPCDSSTSTPDLIEIAATFFEENREDCILPDLEVQDFKELLLLSLNSDAFILGGTGYAQHIGVPMGHHAAPPLAIIFMDFVERRILGSCPQIKLWRRYIDDVFVLFDMWLPPSELLTVNNQVHPNIRFTLELPTDNDLPFLDILIHKGQQFDFSLYIKPTHSGTTLPFSAHVPTSMKRNLMRNEAIRADRNSSDTLRHKSRALLNSRFRDNGYPPRFIHMNFNRQVAPDTPREEDQNMSPTYLELPFVDERLKGVITRLANKTGVNRTTRIYHRGEVPLGRKFRATPEMMICPPNCAACHTAEYRQSCFRKNSIYRVDCAVCGQQYVGESHRTMRSRILEHIRDKKSAVYIHMASHGQMSATNAHTYFSWRILATERFTKCRKSLEALYIRQCTGRLMNGCDGAFPLVYLR